MTTTPPEKGIELLTEAEKIAAERADLEAREAELKAREAASDSDGEDAPPPPWPHGTIEFADETWEVRAPTADVAVAWNMQVSKYAPEQVRSNAPMQFLSRHMSETSLTRLIERFADPDDDGITSTSIGDLITEIFTLETTRPTKPS